MILLKDKKKRKLLIWLISVTLVLTVTVIACAVYLGDYYSADTVAIKGYKTETDMDYSLTKDGSVLFAPEDATVGLIFYPGGKVEYTSYLPLMEECADRGILCVLVEMPFNLAVLDVNAADGIREEYPQIESWYIGGHSLGGSMAASYLENHAEDFEGLILLGSYSTADLSDTALSVLSVYGSEDMVMNRGKYDLYKSNLPSDLTEIVIDGGCHAYFGMYGPQKGDGEPTVTNQEQIKLTAEAITELIKNEK